MDEKKEALCRVAVALCDVNDAELRRGQALERLAADGVFIPDAPPIRTYTTKDLKQTSTKPRN